MKYGCCFSDVFFFDDGELEDTGLCLASCFVSAPHFVSVPYQMRVPPV